MEEDLREPINILKDEKMPKSAAYVKSTQPETIDND
jgi:hypothetical protein